LVGIRSALTSVVANLILSVIDCTVIAASDQCGQQKKA